MGYKGRVNRAAMRYVKKMVNQIETDKSNRTLYSVDELLRKLAFKKRLRILNKKRGGIKAEIEKM